LFRYPGTERETLVGLDLEIPAGSVVAIVGRNGAGKTTLAKLLCGLYSPTSGAVLVDGTPLQNLDLTAWRQRIAVAFQDFARFQFIARQAVGVGDLPHIDSPQLIRSALERAGALDLYQQLGSTLGVQLGGTFGGVEVSFGQWQKLALGRSMMRNLPLLYIIDEPTASLDSATEAALFEGFVAEARRAATAAGTISLLVTHRLASVRSADLIAVIDAGRIIERGRHIDLVALGGVYADLYETQARAYE
jgi:ATP-binding cassette subfamily B protein